MFRLPVGLILCLLAVLLVGCGGSEEHSAEPESTATPVHTRTPEGHEKKAESKGGHGAEEGSDAWLEAVKGAAKAVADEDLSSAEKHCLEALELAGHDAQREIISLHNLAKVKVAQGQFEEGVTFYQQAARMAENEHPAKRDHLFLAGCYNKVGSAFYAQGRLRRSVQALEHAYSILEEHEPEHTPARREVLANLLMVYQAAGNAVKAAEVEALLEEFPGGPTGLEEGHGKGGKTTPPAPTEGWILTWLARQIPPGGRTSVESYHHRLWPADPEYAESRYLGRRWPAEGAPSSAH